MTILHNIHRYYYFDIDNIFQSWTNSFEEFFAYYSSENYNNKTITIPCSNSYLLLHNSETFIFEKVLNCDNYLSFCYP